MIDESLLKSHNIGKDGFSWWLGQVCESTTWAANFPEEPVKGIDELPGFRRRVKVAILGYHTYSKEDLEMHNDAFHAHEENEENEGGAAINDWHTRHQDKHLEVYCDNHPDAEECRVYDE